MRARILVIALCLALLPGAVQSAQREIIGFLPLSGKPDAFTHVISELAGWTMSRTSDSGVVDTGAMMDCVQLDRLKIPAGLADLPANSSLARKTGVNYLVRGVVHPNDDTSLWFRLHIYSAADPTFHRQKTFHTRITKIPATIDTAVQWIASELDIALPKSAEFYGDVSAQALRLIDQSLRLCTGCESDQADVNKAYIIASQARNLCLTNDAVSRWMRSVPYNRQRGIGRLVWSGKGSSGRDRENVSVKSSAIIDDGNSDWNLSGDAWRRDLEIIRSIRGNAQKLQSFYAALISAHPDSPYLRYSAGRSYSMIGQHEAAIQHYSAALRLNPDSYRLRMRLVMTYVEAELLDKALASLQPALQRWPNRSECHLLAAAIHRSNEQYDKAAEHMQLAVKLDPIYVNRQQLVEDYLSAGKIVDSIRAAADTDDRVRRGIVIFSAVLVGIFLAGVLGITILVKILLRA